MIHPMQFKQRLKRFYILRTSPLYKGAFKAENFRYVVQPYKKGRSGWGIFDRLQNCYLKDEEARKLTDKQLFDEQLPTI